MAVGLGFALVFAISAFYGRRNERMLDLVEAGYFPSVKTSSELTTLLAELQRALLDAADASDAGMLAHGDQTYAAFVQTLDRASRNSVADHKRLAELRIAVGQYYTLSRSTTVRMIRGETFAAVAPALALMKERQNATAALLRESNRSDDDAIRSAFVMSRNTQRNTMTVMGAAILAFLAALLIGSMLGDRLQQTQRRNEQLQQSGADLERRNRLILDAAGEGIFGLDANGIVTFINPVGASMLGRNVDGILGSRLNDVIPGHGLTAGSQTTDFKTPNGSSIPVEYTAGTITGDDGLANGTVVTFRDISARLAVERMKDEFVSTVNHELRTPLTSIRGALGLLDNGLLGPVGERGQRMLSLAVQNTDRLIRLINDILDLERIQSGKIELDRRMVAWSDLVRTTVDGVQTLADQASVTLSIEPVDAMVWGDSDRIVQTLTNLVGNAIKFSPAGTAVTIGAREERGGLTFHVMDRGRGIPQDRLEAVFERFLQVDASDSRDKSGSGLGLAICRNIVQAHGGRIWAERRADGGSTFRFTLPEPLRPQRTETVSAADPVLHPTLLIAGMPESSGFDVVVAPGMEGIPAFAANTRPDAIVLDVANLAS